MAILEIKVTPIRQLWFDEETYASGYGAQVNPENRHQVNLNNYGNITLKGNMPKLDIGAEYIAKVHHDEKAPYAGTYLVETIRQEKPITVSEQRQFLSTVLTQNQVDNIFQVFGNGEDIIGMIENNEFDFGSVKGLGEKSYEKVRAKVLDNLEMSEVLVFLSKYGIKYNMISKLVKEYKNPKIVIQKIEDNPYVLTEIKGIGFKKADEIAKAVGYSMESPHRIDSCVIYCIGEENTNGHSWVNRKLLLNKAISLLNISKTLIEDRLDAGIKNVKCVDERYTKKAVYEAEQYISMRLTQMKAQSSQVFTTEELDAFLDSYCEENNVELEENQRQFFYDWNDNNVLLLIGGGGMGKSWLQRILLELVDKKNYVTALLAPTGKASKVMSGYTGRIASTIHRKAGVLDEDEEAIREITEDVIIVDEASMCDVFILSKFLRSVKNHNARVLFVGDDFQLPSVGVGNFLYDAINSNCVTVSRLKKVFRQDDGGILDVSTNARNGEIFLNDTDEGKLPFGKDCLFHLVDQQYILDGIKHYYKNVLKRFKPEDIVILSPTKKGKLGTVAINKEIQKIVNPKKVGKREKTFGKDKDLQVTFREGDLVMNTVNTYEIETVEGGVADVFNGDTGKIIAVDEKEKEMVIDFEGIHVKMKFETVLKTIIHAWCMTIHKSQGSQYDVVITILDKSMKFQLNANLIYTAWSRAKKYLLTLGQADAINHGLKKFANMERRSFMQEMLHQFNGADEVAYEGKQIEAYDMLEEEEDYVS